MKLQQKIDQWLNGRWHKKIGMVLVVSIAVYIVACLIFVWFMPGITNIDGKESYIPKWWMLYYLFADTGNQMSVGYSHNGLRLIGLIMSTLGSIFLSGLLISTITSVFERRADKCRAGLNYYKLKNHTVIIGSDQMVHGLVNQLCEEPGDAIVVMTSTDVEQMKNMLYATLKDKKNRDRIVVNYGLRDSENYLAAINIAYAKKVYMLGDTSEFDDIESFHDSLNVQCLTIIAKLCKAAGRQKLPCHVLFDYKTTYHAFQYADLSAEITESVEFHPFNFYDLWARKVLVVGGSKGENISYKPLDYIPITDSQSDKYVHFVIIGMSKMGQALALQAAHIAHFPNYRKRKTKITFIDRNGAVEMDEFKQKCGELFKVSRSTYIDAHAWYEAERKNLAQGGALKNEEVYTTHYTLAKEYQHLVNDGDSDKEFIDIEWQFINGDDHNPVVQRLLEGYALDGNAIVTVAVCLNLTHISLRSSMYLPKIFYEKNIPILVQQRKTSTIVSTLNGKDRGENDRECLRYKNITPFGMVYDCYDLHLVSSVEICKRINAVYDYYFKNDALPTHIDTNKANQLWETKSIAKRWSNIFAAASIPTKLRCVGVKWDVDNKSRIPDLTDSQVAILAEIEHNRWNVEELLLGYRPVRSNEDEDIDENKDKKDKYKKGFIHYDIRPYDGLKTDANGKKANLYDEVIVKALPLVLDCNHNK